MRLLIAEDNKDISKALAVFFEKNSFCVDVVYNGNDAFDYAVTGNYDGIILDIMMPGYDGIQVLEMLREKKVSTPILMLTAKGELEDRVNGLDAGADDYLPKPFAMSELLSRVKAMLRRRNDFQPDVAEMNGVKLNRSTLSISYQTKSIRLVTREFQVLEMLWDNKGRIVSSESMMEHIWGWNAEVEMNIVWVTISNIRKKLISVGAPLTISAVRGVGYKLEAQS